MALEFDGKIFVSPQEAAKRIDRSYNTVKAKNKEWGWTKWKVGRKIYFSLDDVESWIKENLQRAS